MKQNLITLKLRYTTDNRNYILSCMQDYSKILKFTYNRILDNPEISTKQITELQKQMNNVFLDSHFKNSARIEALGLNRENKVCFGSKYYTQYIKGKITKEQLNILRLCPIYSVGESISYSNRKFRILNERQILFCPNKQNHIILFLENYKNYKKYFDKLQYLQNLKQIPITYKLDLEYVYMTFDLNKLQQQITYKPIKNRVFGIDLNPNYIGWSVVDWITESSYKIIDTGVVSIKEINDKENNLKGKHVPQTSTKRKHLHNKRYFEVIKIGQNLCNIAKHYQCESFVLEGLDIISKDNCRGKKFNRLVNNQWNRKRLVTTIRKYCGLYNIELVEVMANYSSFIGNLVFRDTNLPDMVLSSIEIGRRGYEFNLQYIKKTKNKKKNIIFPELHVVKDRITHALEVLGYSEKYENLKELYDSLKNTKLKYRVSLESLDFKVLSLLSIKSGVKLYTFL